MQPAQKSAVDVDLMDLSIFTEGREHAAFNLLRDHDPLHWNDEPDGPGFWSVTRYEDLVKVLDRPLDFINGEGTSITGHRSYGAHPTVHNQDPPRHTQLRALIVPHLRAMRVRQWQPLIDEAVDEVIDKVSLGEEIDFVGAVASQIPIRVLGFALGVPREDHSQLIAWTNKLTSQDPEFVRSPEDTIQARTALFAYFEDLAKRRRVDPQDDLVTKLVEARLEGEPLPWADLAAYYFLLVGAGNETTRNLMTGAVLAFGEHPDEWDRLRADPSMLRVANDEIMRYVSPVRAMRRTAAIDVPDFHGRTIKAGDKVVCWFQAANRDDRVFENPHTIKIDRTPNDHLGFGWGIHACLGLHLSRAEMMTFLGRLLDKDWRIALTSEPDRLQDNALNAVKRLSVIFEKA